MDARETQPMMAKKKERAALAGPLTRAQATYQPQQHVFPQCVWRNAFRVSFEFAGHEQLRWSPGYAYRKHTHPPRAPHALSHSILQPLQNARSLPIFQAGDGGHPHRSDALTSRIAAS